VWTKRVPQHLLAKKLPKRVPLLVRRHCPRHFIGATVRSIPPLAGTSCSNGDFLGRFSVKLIAKRFVGPVLECSFAEFIRRAAASYRGSYWSMKCQLDQGLTTLGRQKQREITRIGRDTELRAVAFEDPL
jgi:hypothetical protein